MWMSLARILTASVRMRVTSLTIGASSPVISIDLSIDLSTERSIVLSIESVTSDWPAPTSLDLPSLPSMYPLIADRLASRVSISVLSLNRSMSCSSRFKGSWMISVRRPFVLVSGRIRCFLIRSSGTSLASTWLAIPLDARSTYSSPNWLARALATISSFTAPSSISMSPMRLPLARALLTAPSTVSAETAPQPTRISPSFCAVWPWWKV